MKPKIPKVSSGPWLLRALCVRAAGAGLLFAPSGSRKSFPFRTAGFPVLLSEFGLGRVFFPPAFQTGAILGRKKGGRGNIAGGP